MRLGPWNSKMPNSTPKSYLRHRSAATSCRRCFPVLALVFIAATALAEERHEAFDRDPQWEGVNNRAIERKPRTIKQDFGYSANTAHAGGKPGEIGGLITPAAEPAFYAKKIGDKGFSDRLMASGKVFCAGPRFHVLI